MHVKKGDTVMVIAGKDKGAVGKVIAAFPTQDRVIVEGVNLVKKHTKIGQTNRGAKTGGITTQEAAVHVSNVLPVVKVDGKDVPTRVGYRVDDDGTKVRIAKRTNEEL